MLKGTEDHTHQEMLLWNIEEGSTQDEEMENLVQTETLKETGYVLGVLQWHGRVSDTEFSCPYEGERETLGTGKVR